MAGHRRAEATPSLRRLRPAMTVLVQSLPVDAAFLLRNRLHHAADRAAGNGRHLLVLHQHRVVFGQGFELLLGLHLHDLVAAGLQAAQQRRQTRSPCASADRASG